jgi:hypothetical protein
MRYKKKTEERWKKQNKREEMRFKKKQNKTEVQ